MPRHSFRLEKSSGFCHPGAFQLALASLAPTTGVKSAAYSMGRWRFKESLGKYVPPLTSGFITRKVTLQPRSPVPVVNEAKPRLPSQEVDFAVRSGVT